MKTYKYVLLNISIWAFLTDFVLEIVLIPMPELEVFGVYAGGLAMWLGSSGAFACAVGAFFFIAEYLVALLLAFFYRYAALHNELEIKKWQYVVGTVLIMTVPPGAWTGGIIVTYMPQDVFRRSVGNTRPDLLPLFQHAFMGFDKKGILIGSAVLFVLAMLWIGSVAWCIVKTAKLFRVRRPSMTDSTYRLHVKLLRALAVQAAAPITLFSVPISVDAICFIFGLPIINDMIKLTIFCVFATDLLLEIVVLPAPVFDISAVYSTGLASLMGSKASFVCEVIAIASVAEYLAALLFAFFYRYLALKNDVYLCGKPIERRHYCIGCADCGAYRALYNSNITRCGQSHIWA
ncbi:hypothetical protein QR680_015595 [Steinernema hermaphroditum]|uniref:Uncharacterized protein n=1 Tax=Steinernema hermaphroditum TaxID=289476 RepID=A0AA39H8B8_9BILA|nr:hypothetical protein QR680_015595 [Steinernema hermaphroditum]